MRRLCTVQVRKAIAFLALLAWFYGAKLPLENYPGAFSIMMDGPFRTKAECEKARQEYQNLANTFGISIEVTKCYEKQPA